MYMYIYSIINVEEVSEPDSEITAELMSILTTNQTGWLSEEYIIPIN